MAFYYEAKGYYNEAFNNELVTKETKNSANDVKEIRNIKKRIIVKMKEVNKAKDKKLAIRQAFPEKFRKVIEKQRSSEAKEMSKEESYQLANRHSTEREVLNQKYNKEIDTLDKQIKNYEAEIAKLRNEEVNFNQEKAETPNTKIKQKIKIIFGIGIVTMGITGAILYNNNSKTLLLPNQNESTNKNNSYPLNLKNLNQRIP